MPEKNNHSVPGENDMPDLSDTPDMEAMWSAMQRESVDDTRFTTRPEDPRIQREAASQRLLTDADLSRLKAAVADFVKREFDDELDESAFDDPSCIGIAETNAEDREDIVIDMAVNLQDMTLDQYINGEKLDSWHYSDINALIGEIRHISFDELVSLGPNAERRVEQLMAQPSDEHDFIRNPEDGFAIYQLSSDASNHELRFASMDDLRRDARRMRDAVHSAVERGQEVLYPSKESVEQFLRDEGLTVLPTDDPALITVISPAKLESTVYLIYGNDCCTIDGCNTSAVDQLVKKDNYVQVYSGPMPDECLTMEKPDDILESLYSKFNLDRPADFRGHSLSVSDVIVLKQNGEISSFYTDSFGFEKLPGFLLPENHLRTAEMSMEDDYDMIDGVINNGSRQEKPSVLETLKECRTEMEPREKLPKEHREPER